MLAQPYWVEESRKVPVVTKISGRLKMPSNWSFAKVPKLNEEIANQEKKQENLSLPQTSRQKAGRNSEISKPGNLIKCLMQPFNISSNPLNLKRS